MRIHQLKYYSWILMGCFANVFFMAACSSNVDTIRQKNLDTSLAKHYRFGQSPATAASPLQYRVCDAVNYPCRLVTPIYSAAKPNSVAAKIAAPAKKPDQRKILKETKPHHSSKRTAPCKTSS